MQIREFTVSENPAMRLDAYLASKLGELSRSAVRKLIDSGRVKVNSQTEVPSYRVRQGDRLVVEIPPAEPSDIVPEPIALDVVYEDEQIVVINKAKGMTVHPAPGSPHGTLVNAILAHSSNLSEIGGCTRPGIVHRLDKDTSGLIVVAKSDKAHSCLQAQIQQRTAERKYLAIVWGVPGFEEAVVDAPIGRHPTDRKRMAVIKDPQRHTARRAVTRLRVVERYGNLALVEARLETGRTHQVRVHCSFVGHPVVGDPVYGGTRRAIPTRLCRVAQQELSDLLEDLHGQALHAFSLSFDHPTTGKRLSFQVDPPADFQALLDWLRTVRSG